MARRKTVEPKAEPVVELGPHEPVETPPARDWAATLDAMIAAREAGHLGAEREKAAAQLEVLRELRGMMGA